MSTVKLTMDKEQVIGNMTLRVVEDSENPQGRVGYFNESGLNSYLVHRFKEVLGSGRVKSITVELAD